MKKSKNYTIIIFLAFACVCCAPEKEHTIIHFSREDFKQQINLTDEIIELDSVMYDKNPIFFNLIRDSLVFIEYYDGRPYFLKVFNLNTSQNIANLARKGHGPGEYLSCKLHYRTNDDYFYTHDIVKQHALKYHIDSVLAKGASYKPIQAELPRYTGDFIFYDDSTIIGYNNYYFNDKKIGNNKVNPLFKMNLLDGIHDIADLSKADLYTANVSRARIYSSPNKDYFWLADAHEDRIEIFNKDFEIVKTMSGPDFINPEYLIRRENHLSFQNQYKAYFHFGFCTENSIYLLYHGLDGASSNYCPSTTEIFKFSWSGELLVRYQLDRLILRITVNDNEEYFYGSYTPHWFGSDIKKLVRFKIPE